MLEGVPPVGARLCCAYRCGYCVVTANDGPYFSVHWERSEDYVDGYDQYDYKRFTRVCHHCGLSKENHADNGQCLYSPTRWKE